MQSESQYVGIFHNIYKSGLINKQNKKTFLELTHQNIIPLSRVNQFFFGSNLFVGKLNYTVLHKESMITKHDGQYYIYISKLEKYLNEVCDVLDIENKINCCPFNYLKIFGQSGRILNGKYFSMICAFESFIHFIKLKQNNDANTIVNIMVPNYKLEGEVVKILELDEYLNDMVIKFDKKGKPLFITLTWSMNKNLSYPNRLRICNNVEIDEYEVLYDYICEQLRMDTPEDYLINNLDRVCGSRDFSEIMVKSYLSKHEFKYSLDSISSVILWKDSKSYNKYKDYFLSRYEHCTVLDDDQILLNFEGINKFLLNINEDYVENFEVKEQINDMYYNCMTELINSFEKLYKNK
jgi:hypothetical protein